MLLRVRNDDFGSRLRFARHVRALADRENDDVRLAGSRDGLLDATRDGGFGIGALSDDQSGLVGKRTSDAAG